MIKTKKNMPRIIVIGGGATGCGVARDLVLRGYKTIPKLLTTLDHRAARLSRNLAAKNPGPF